MKMKALSLWQPWAQAMRCDIKRIETRSWPTTYRGPLALHAAKRWTREQRELCDLWPFTLCSEGLNGSAFGAVIAVVELYDCVPTVDIEPRLTPRERAIGNYAPGRFAWFTRYVRATGPVFLTGRQGLWNVDIDVDPYPRAVDVFEDCEQCKRGMASTRLRVMTDRNGFVYGKTLCQTCYREEVGREVAADAQRGATDIGPDWAR